MKKFLYFFVFIVMSLSVFAQVPFQPSAQNTQTPTNSLTIVGPLNQYYPIKTNTSFNFDVLNSNLTKLTSVNTNCTFFVANNSGGLEIKSNLTYSSANSFWNTYYTTNDFGVHSFYVYCNSANGENGYFIEDFEVTNNGLEPNEADLKVPIIVIFLIMFYLFIIYTFKDDNFSQHGLIKSMMVMLSVWIVLIPLQMAITYSTFSTGAESITTLLQTLYQIIIWLNFSFTFYMIIWLIVSFIKKLQGKGGEEHDED